MRGRGVFFCLLGALCLLLMLSALVEAPSSGESESQEPPAMQRIVILAYTIPAREQPESISLSLSTSPLAWAMILPGLFALSASIPLSFGRDANGRWIRKKRYVNSVYEVFLQELASG